MALPDRAITLVHSSDIHIDGRASETFHPLCKVVNTAVLQHADVLLLAGDVFDHNRLPLEQISRRGNIKSSLARRQCTHPGLEPVQSGELLP